MVGLGRLALPATSAGVVTRAAQSLREHQRELELRIGVAAVGGIGLQPARLGQALLDAAPAGVGEPEQMESLGSAGVGGLAQPADAFGFGADRRQSQASEQQGGRDQPALGGVSQERDAPLGIRLDTGAAKPHQRRCEHRFAAVVAIAVFGSVAAVVALVVDGSVAAAALAEVKRQAALIVRCARLAHHLLRFFPPRLVLPALAKTGPLTW
jgi:hypothetical protein